MGRRVPAAAAAWIVAIALPAAAGPPADAPPTISFASSQISLAEGPTAPCSDAIDAGELRTPLVVDDPDGSPEGSLPPAVAHTEGGDAEVGVDYEPLPPTFDPAEFVRVLARDGAVPSGSTVTLTITLEPGDGYVVGEPSTLAVTIVHADRRCDAPTFAAVSTNSAQTIAVGGRPVPLQLVDPVNGTAFAALVGGQLPPGIGLRDDGTFTGAAQTAGTYVATVGSCRSAFTLPPGVCTRATLTITVAGESLADRTPPCSVSAVGARSSALGPFAFDAAGSALVFIGASGTSASSTPFLYRPATARLVALPHLSGDPAIDWASGIDISADGRTVVYDQPWVEVDLRYFTDVTVYDAVTGEARVAFRVEGFVGDVVLSPDGRQAYVTVVGDGPHEGISVGDLRTGTVTRLTSQVPRLVDVSPDGAWLLGSHLSSTVLIDTSTGAISELPAEADEPVAFGPSSSVVLAVDRLDDGARLLRHDLAAGTATSVPTVDGLAQQPAVAASRSARSLAHVASGDPFGSNPDGGAELFLLPPSGTLLQVTETSGAGRMAAAGVTEDGGAVAFVAPGSLDAAGRGTLNETGFPSELHLARCGGAPLARTG